MIDLLPSLGIDSHWRRRAPAARTLLVVYAHPDDESFSNAGTIARYSAAGVAVHYACATRGECGMVDPALLADHPDLAALRTAELACAAQALDLAAVHYLGYRDSGMAGTPDNMHPAALVQAPVAAVAARLVALIRALRPQVVLTHGPYGGYGHPDHIHVHRALRAAFTWAGHPARYPEQIAAGLAPWRPPKLYYSTFPIGLLRAALPLLRLVRRDPRRFGQNADVDLVRVAEEATPVTTVVACAAYLAQKEAAWRCHASQFGGMGWAARLPTPVRRRFLGMEYFTRVAPAWRRGRERDLFAGLRAGRGQPR
jgi:mycothiol S-conjugate amidase